MSSNPVWTNMAHLIKPNVHIHKRWSRRYFVSNPFRRVCFTWSNATHYLMAFIYQRKQWSRRTSPVFTSTQQYSPIRALSTHLVSLIQIRVTFNEVNMFCPSPRGCVPVPGAGLQWWSCLTSHQKWFTFSILLTVALQRETIASSRLKNISPFFSRLICASNSIKDESINFTISSSNQIIFKLH